MRNLLRKTIMASIIVAITIVSFGLIADASEKKEQTYVKSNFRTASKTTVAIADVPGHEIAQEMSVADMKYASPDFKVKEEWAYIHTDSTGGSGKQTGYYIDTHEDGSQTYGTFQGTITTTIKPDGSWEATWEGIYQYLGGAGKYKNIKGNGKYKGKGSSQNPAREEGQEIVEY